MSAELLSERELAWVEQAAGREPGSVLARLVAEVRALRTAMAGEQELRVTFQAEAEQAQATIARLERVQPWGAHDVDPDALVLLVADFDAALEAKP